MSQNPTDPNRYQFANPSMTNGNDRTAQSQRPLGANALPQAGPWASSSNIWGTSSSTALPSRETIGSRGSPKEATTDTADDSWRRRSNWGNENSQSRNTSSSTSPNRTRDTVSRNIPNPSPYFSAAQLPAQPAIGQRTTTTNGTGHWNTAPALNTSPGTASRIAQPAGYVNDDAAEVFAAGGLNTYSLAGMNIRAGTSPSSGGDSVEQRFNRLSISNGLAASSADNESFATLNRPGTGRSFQFNPSSQAWETPRGNSNGGRFPSNQGGAMENPYFNNLYGPGASSQGAPSSTTLPARDQQYRPGSGGQRSIPDMNSRVHGRQEASALPNHVYGAPYYDPFAALPPLYPPTYSPNVGPAFAPVPQHQPRYGHGNFTPGPGGPHPRASRAQDPADAQRSPLLREFRQAHNTNKRYELKDIYGHILEFAGDQYGSRFIQDKLTTANSDEKDRVFEEMAVNAMQMAKDIFGNYVMQKLFDHGNQIQKKLLAQQMKGQVLALSLNDYGCRVVQKALEVILVEQQVEIVRELEPEILKAIKDKNGNHVIQKVLQHVPRQYTGFIYQSFRGRVKELCCHQCACRVVQKAIGTGTEADQVTIVEDVLPHARELANDQYGNYVIQHIVLMDRPEYTTRVINSILGDIVHLSRQKFASNVVEGCGKRGTPEERLKMEAQFLRPRPDGTIPLQMMVVDQFANYVIQKHITHTPNRQGFIEALRPHLERAQKSSDQEGAKRATQIVKCIEELPAQAPTATQTTPSSRHASMVPTSPSLQLDVGSAAPTPNLTNEPNSPSSSPPSTTDSAIDEPVGGTMKERTASVGVVGHDPELRVEDS